MTAGGQWSLAERASALAGAERTGLDLLVIGGGITGAGVARDAASRGLRTLLVERDDFASGTSSRSSKMIHGGFRYIAEAQLRMTREACRERDLLLELNPNLVRPLAFLLPAYPESSLPLWQIRAALALYATLASFRRTSRFRMLSPTEVASRIPGLRTEGLRGAGSYTDAQVDDARLVLETLKSARRLGAEALNYCEAAEFERGPEGRIQGVRVRDRLACRDALLRVSHVVNAAGPAVERVRGLDRPVERPELRPAKGIHLVIPETRLHPEAAVVFEAEDGRRVFLTPWEDVTLIGTTDEFSAEIDDPSVQIEEVHYLLAAANRAFPRAGLTTNDLSAVFAGVRPLIAESGAERPSSSVSREHRIYEDPSGLVSVAGGKLTTFRSMAESIVDKVLARGEPRSRHLARSTTRKLPLREDDFDRPQLESELGLRYGLDARRCDHLVRAWGADAVPLLEEAPPALREPIGDSPYLYAEIPWSLRVECPASLCDLLERRLRVALACASHGLPQISRIADVAAETAGWDAERRSEEIAAYTESVRRHYQILPPVRAAAAA